jgi:hypothetical protein
MDPSYLSQMSGPAGSGGSHANSALSKIIESLQGMYDLIAYEMNFRDISVENLTLLEQHLRSNIKEIDRSSSIKNLELSKDEVLDCLRQARRKVNLAADILDPSRPPFHSGGQRNAHDQVYLQEQLYRYYEEICLHLNHAIISLQKDL